MAHEARPTYPISFYRCDWPFRACLYCLAFLGICRPFFVYLRAHTRDCSPSPLTFLELTTMFSKNFFAIALTLLMSSAFSAGTPIAAGKYLEATTLVTKNNASALECWRFASPLSTSSGAGTAGASTLVIDNLANATYTVIPPRFEGGVHNAPHPQ